MQDFYKTQNLILDEKDNSIIKLLIKNARISIAEIVHKTNILRDTVSYRLKKLEESKLILGYHTIVDPTPLGYNYFSIILIKLKPYGETEVKAFLERISKIKNITHINRTLGVVDLVLYVVAKNASEYAEIVDEIKNNPERIIFNIETLNITKEIKIDDFSGLFENTPTTLENKTI